MKQMIIRTLLVVCSLCAAVCANAQMSEFEKYADMKNVTYVYISKLMLQLAGEKMDGAVSGVNMRSLMGKLDGIQIILTDNPEAKGWLKDEVRKLVKRDGFEVMMQVDDDAAKVAVYFKEGKKKSAVIMQTVMAGDVVQTIVFTGAFDMEDVMKMFEDTKAWNLPVVDGKVYKGFVSKSKIFNSYRDILKKFSDE